MTTRSEPDAADSGGGRPDPGLDAIMSERRQLINLTYRLLGSLAEAEDAVQETSACSYAVSRQQQHAIAPPGAWLSTVASRVCLSLLGSARARRETYVGEWIPEPLPEPTEWVSGRPGGTTTDPADRVTLDESVSMAFLVVLESMTPAERVALILHDVFRYSFAEIAEITRRGPRTRRPPCPWPQSAAEAAVPRPPGPSARPRIPTPARRAAGLLLTIRTALSRPPPASLPPQASRPTTDPPHTGTSPRRRPNL